jgi:hypothetical protein
MVTPRVPLGIFRQRLQHKPCLAGNVAEYADYGFDSLFQERIHGGSRRNQK